MIFLGLLAGALTTGCWLPQLRRSWRTRSTADLSWTYLFVLGGGIALWLVYGLVGGQPAIIVTNGLTLLLVLALGGFKARFDRRRDVAAVLFDMDGTLVDSDAAVERTWRTWARQYGFDEEEVLAVSHGHPTEATLRRMAPDLSAAERDEAAQLMFDLECTDLADVVAGRGAHRLLAVLAERKIPWAVVTSAGRRLAEVRLAAAGIDAPVLLSLDDVARGKPEPDGYLKAAAELGIDPAACLVVEDSEPGIAAGRAAGMRVAALRGLPAELSIVHLGELTDLI